MTVTYMELSVNRVTVDGSLITATILNGKVELKENDYWTALLVFNNMPTVYPSPITINSAIKVEVADNSLASPTWKTIFSGTVLFPDYTFGSETKIAFQCVGKGYPLNMMNCAEEYGTQSLNPSLDAINGVITDTSKGVIPKWCNKYAGTTYSSGYSIDTTYVENLIGTIPYLYSPWKPINKFIDDLCDLNTALVSGTYAGPHWIVDHDGKLRIKRVGATQTGWTLYYGNSQANATLTAGVDFFDGDFQPVGKEANVILYYGNWRRPSSGDSWTENTSSLWGVNAYTVKSDSSTVHIVGLYSIKAVATNGVLLLKYPSSSAHWNFSVFPEFTKPTVNLYVQVHNPYGGMAVVIRIVDNNGASLFTDITSSVSSADVPAHFEFPIGPFYKMNHTANSWTNSYGGAFDWSDVSHIQIEENNLVTGSVELYVDGLHFGGAPILRVARQEFPDEVVSGRGTLGTAANPVKFKVITDNTGKDDSLNATDDSGLMAQLDKAELLRAVKETINGKFSTPMIPDVLPGQYVYLGKDYRVTKITQEIGADYRTHFEVTDDLTNSHSRLRYEDQNKIWAANRPEWQDRQAASLKASNIDIRVARLEKAYNI
jgi:hypothetical protein